MQIESIPYIGEMMAVMTAIIWASAVVLFKKSGETVHPVGLNFFKNFLSVLLLIPTLYFLGLLSFRDLSNYEYFIILTSGAIGIGVADTFFFKCLNYLGAGTTAIVDCLYSPSVIGFSFLFLGESLTYLQIVGVLFIISAVFTVTYTPDASVIHDKRRMLRGLMYGLSAMLLNGFGVVIVKPILEQEPLLWMTTIRLIGGLLVLVVFLFFNKNRQKIVGSIFHGGIRKSTIASSILGAYIGMIFWLGGMKYTQASTASALNQTSSVFIFIFAYFILKEKITIKKTIGIILAVAGALLVIFNS